MKNKSLLLIILFLLSVHCYSQQNEDLDEIDQFDTYATILHKVGRYYKPTENRKFISVERRIFKNGSQRYKLIKIDDERVNLLIERVTLQSPVYNEYYIKGLFSYFFEYKNVFYGVNFNF